MKPYVREQKELPMDVAAIYVISGNDMLDLAKSLYPAQDVPEALTMLEKRLNAFACRFGSSGACGIKKVYTVEEKSALRKDGKYTQVSLGFLLSPSTDESIIRFLNADEPILDDFIRDEVHNVKSEKDFTRKYKEYIQKIDRNTERMRNEATKNDGKRG